MTITAKIIKDSVNPWGKRITTFELEYPRMIHSEFMTHRVFSRNAASSRAIPIAKVIEQVKTNPAMPFKWGKNQAGMQAKEELTPDQQKAAEALWIASRNEAAWYATAMMELGLHKQVVNRILEPYQHIKVVMTTTEYENWKWLRLHQDADPTIYELARVMHEAREESVPSLLYEGMWHLPYVITDQSTGAQKYFDDDFNEITLDQALKISVSSCGQVSYRKLDTSLEKAEDIYKRLIESQPVHASPTEHQAMVARVNIEDYEIPKGVTAVSTNIDKLEEMTEKDAVMALISGNFTGGWIQNRQLIPDNVKLD